MGTDLLTLIMPAVVELREKGWISSDEEDVIDSDLEIIGSNLPAYIDTIRYKA